MKRVSTSLRGVTTTSLYEDGDMYSLVNLRRKGGALHPVAGHVVSATLSAEYDLYFVHRNENWEHFVGIVHELHELHEISRIYWDIDSSVVEMTPSGGVPGPVNSVEQNGNMLIFVTSTTTYYALFRNGGYTWYGELPDLIPLEWNCLEEHEYETDGTLGNPSTLGKYIGIKTLSIFADAHYFNNTVGKFHNPFDNIYQEGWIFNKEIKSDDLLDLQERLKGFANEMQNSLGEKYLSGGVVDDNLLFRGLFFDAFFVRYAYRLFDDTNIKLSPPILIMPSSVLADRITIESSWWYQPKLASNHVNYGFDAELGMMYLRGFVPGLKYDLGSLSAFEGLITGVDVFVSPALNISSVENMNKPQKLFSFTFTGEIDINVPSGEASTVSIFDNIDKKKISDMAEFYLVKSLSIGDSTGGAYVPFPEKTDMETIKAINNLVHREQLVDDTQSVHRTGAAKSFMYNQRLHLADVTTTFFGGFSKQYFGWLASNLGGLTYRWCYNGKGPVFTYSGGVWDALDDLIVETELQYGSQQGRAYSFYRDDTYGFLSAMLSYPASGATRMSFYWVDHVTGDIWRIGSFPLKDHEFLDISYYLDPNLDGIYLDQFSPDAVRLSSGEADELRSRAGVPFTARMPNELRVAETYNPLRFLNKNVYPVGSGRIRSMGSNVMDVSNYNYGVFPLYVFTTDGVFSLRVGEGTTAYSVVMQPAFTEPVVSDVTCQIPAGVLFLTARGLFLINGRSVEFLSGAIEEPAVDLRFERSPEMDIIMQNAECRMQNCSMMVYNNYKHEVVVVCPSAGFNWVLCLSDGSFYMSTDSLTALVRNTMPNLLAMSGRDVLDFSREEGAVHVSFVTRPISFGTSDVKFLERMILRGTFYGVGDSRLRGNDMRPVVVTHRSNDGRNFLCSKGFFMKTGNLRDFDTGLYGRTKFRWYTFSLGMVCAPETVIEYLESEVEKGFENTKMR